MKIGGENRESTTFVIVTNRCKWNRSIKVRRGSKSSKLNETVRNSKVSLPEKIPIEQIKDTSFWHRKY